MWLSWKEFIDDGRRRRRERKSLTSFQCSNLNFLGEALPNVCINSHSSRWNSKLLTTVWEIFYVKIKFNIFHEYLNCTFRVISEVFSEDLRLLLFHFLPFSLSLLLVGKVNYVRTQQDSFNFHSENSHPVPSVQLSSEQTWMMINCNTKWLNIALSEYEKRKMSTW